ncbi:MAG: hypothetical protein WD096_00580 [Actinomycetota bacterium]
MRRGSKYVLGIPMVLIGFFVTLGGAAAMAVFGLDGTFRLESGVHSSGHALVFDALSLRGLRPSGAWKADVRIEVLLSEGGPAFVGVAPREDAAAYLADAVVDRVVQLRPVGGLQTERAEGPTIRREPGPPGEQTFWVASVEGSPATLAWTATSGDWSIVVMRMDGRQRIHGDGVLSLTIDAIGPLSVALLVAGTLLLGGGSALVISGAKTPRTNIGRRSPGAPPSGGTPARPDAV